jgi:hypothetical protein
MVARLPRTTNALVSKKSPPERTPLFHDAVVQAQPIPQLKYGEILVKIGAAAFNHRDVRLCSYIWTSEV